MKPKMENGETLLSIRLGGRDEAIAFMESHTKDEVAAFAGSGDKAVQVWEIVYGVRCSRICRICGGKFEYFQMELDKQGRNRGRCLECREKAVRATTPRERFSKNWETRLIPKAILESPRKRMSRLEGINGYPYSSAIGRQAFYSDASQTEAA